MDPFEAALEAIVGAQGLLRGADAAPHCVDWRGLYRGHARAVVRPASTAEVARVVALCREHGVPIVPQGGNTGLVGGATPSPAGDSMILLTGRMNRIREIDAANGTLTAEAGAPLAVVREAAAESGLMFPLSIGSEGSAQIGGVLAANAGGSGTARYGNARDLALGLEVVLPDGRVWNGLRKLRKDNSGYCLRHLMMGAEGTLGIITAAVLRLVPAPRSVATAFCSVSSTAAGVALLSTLRTAMGGDLHTFEYMSRRGLGLVLRHIPGTRLPVAPADHHILVEFAAATADGARPALEEALSAAYEEGLVTDAVLADSETARAGFWRLREAFAEAQVRHGPHVKCDIAVPISAASRFLDTVGPTCARAFPGCSVVLLSHLGDGNIHCNVHAPEGWAEGDFSPLREEIAGRVDALAVECGGTFSAEHGIGAAKLGEMARFKDPVELELMRTLRRALDPDGLMNPGKLIPA
ncbi:FAD-binding oxidoreductase [Methylobacterium sp. J-076]|uniref:FAD-binding oxidoreductase n=1 Tax=Methylobacterium sp. J-076 TaxID=2836655 RepID=UPI001FBBCFA0|nr:FAD-binding oxidoreductase [Methylobacterium sp. J-076]MCJ2014299.1 FAD-binding oxidoreductase [Methylobacterium sp. J-076]